jgi:C-terminal processing protease CtpA/Prc
VPKGSPQYVRHHSLRHLRFIQFVRREMGLPETDELRVEVQSADGKSAKELRLKVTNRAPAYGIWPKTTTRLLEANIGYLRIPMMDDAAVGEMKNWMPRFRQTEGLVVDVRDNGGGSRDPLLLLHSYLSAPNDAPKVVNAAVYRLAEGFQDDHLEARFMYREEASIWSQPEREAIAAFKKNFRAQWTPPLGAFSEWHYLVLSRQKDFKGFYYDKPVVVLMNEKCFSATDIFLAGLKGLSNVTLAGRASGGGSARKVSVRLNGSNISVSLGSMVSFQANGRLFDGNGVAPDIVVEPEPAYFVGGRDNVIEQAVDIIRRRAAGKSRQEAESQHKQP